MEEGARRFVLNVVRKPVPQVGKGRERASVSIFRLSIVV